MDGYHPFVFDATETTQGGTWFFISDSLAFKKRDDLKFNSPGNYESTFIEVIRPKRKNMILGCIYRHPTSTIPVHRFDNEYILPLLEKISIEDKLSSLMGDFNIDLLKNYINEDVNTFYNSLSSHFFTPYILQPTRPISKFLIDNILIILGDFLLTAVISLFNSLITFFNSLYWNVFFKEIVPRKLNLYERKYKKFNEREFNEALTNMNWNEILSLDKNDKGINVSDP